MKTTWKTTVDFGEYHSLFRFLWMFPLFHIWMVINIFAGKKRNRKTLFCYSSVTSSYLKKKKKSFLARLFVQLFVDHSCSTDTCQTMLWWRVLDCLKLDGGFRWPQRWQSEPLRRSLLAWHLGWPPSPLCLFAGLGPAQQPGVKTKEKEEVKKGKRDILPP